MGNSEEKLKSSTLGNAFANPDRREFVKLAMGGALGVPALLSSTSTASATVHPNEPGFKLTGQAPAKPTDDDLLFFNQLKKKIGRAS